MLQLGSDVGLVQICRAMVTGVERQWGGALGGGGRPAHERAAPE